MAGLWPRLRAADAAKFAGLLQGLPRSGRSSPYKYLNLLDLI
jgi:hypothetical protein